MSWPVVLPHGQITLLRDRNASVLILTRRLKRGRHEIQDGLTVRRNAAYRRDGRMDLQTDPTVFAVEILAAEPRSLLDLDLITVRRAGHRTLEDFYLDWLGRRRRVDAATEVYLHVFKMAEDARYLASKIHRAYTSDPGQSVASEGQALSPNELNRYAKAAFDRDDAMRRERVKAATERIGQELVALRADLRVVGGGGRRVERAIESVERTASALTRSA